MPNIFKDGGGAGIGSFVVVFKNGVMAPNTDLIKLRGAYAAGDNIFFSIVDDQTEDALVQASGWIGEDKELHLIARDFDDSKTYGVVVSEGGAEVSQDVTEGIAIGDEGTIAEIKIEGHTLVLP